MAFLLLRWQLRFPPFPIAFIIVPFVFYYICMCVQPLRRALRVVLSLVFSFPVLFFFSLVFHLCERFPVERRLITDENEFSISSFRAFAFYLRARQTVLWS